MNPSLVANAHRLEGSGNASEAALGSLVRQFCLRAVELAFVSQPEQNAKALEALGESLTAALTPYRDSLARLSPENEAENEDLYSFIIDSPRWHIGNVLLRLMDDAEAFNRTSRESDVARSLYEGAMHPLFPKLVAIQKQQEALSAAMWWEIMNVNKPFNETIDEAVGEYADALRIKALELIKTITGYDLGHDETAYVESICPDLNKPIEELELMPIGYDPAA